MTESQHARNPHEEHTPTGAEQTPVKPPRMDTHPITRIVPPVWLLITMIAMYGLHSIVPLAYLVIEWMRPIGQILVFAGFTIMYFAARQFRQAQTPLKPFVPVKALICDGLFRYSRNPVYLGMAILLVGWALYLGSLTPWGLVVGFIWAIRRFWVLPEEIMMERSMGDAYRAYKQEVRRWL